MIILGALLILLGIASLFTSWLIGYIVAGVLILQGAGIIILTYRRWILEQAMDESLESALKEYRLRLPRCKPHNWLLPCARCSQFTKEEAERLDPT